MRVGSARGPFGLRWGAQLAGALALASAGCTPEHLAVGEQCPSPDSKAATFADDIAEVRYSLYGTTCAPCDDGDQPQLDGDGCPVFVTFESCGGDICIGRRRVPWPFLDSGIPDGGMEAGTPADGGEDDEDGGEDDEDGGA